jgi:hypothetical protein
LLGLLTACTAGRPPSEPAKPAASGLPPQATAPANTGSGNQDVASPANGGPRNWQVSQGEGQLALREAASASAKVLSTYPAGTILDNLGCQPGEGGMWCDVQPLGGGPRGFVPATRLRPAVSPDGRVARGPDDSALRAGQGKFDANGTLPCAQELGQPMGPCSFAVARAGGGYATVVITKPEGGTRAIHFRLGRAIGADTSEADASGPFHLKREQDLNLIRVGKERYEIPDAVVLGG